MYAIFELSGFNYKSMQLLLSKQYHRERKHFFLALVSLYQENKYPRPVPLGNTQDIGTFFVIWNIKAEIRRPYRYEGEDWNRYYIEKIGRPPFENFFQCALISLPLLLDMVCFLQLCQVLQSQFIIANSMVPIFDFFRLSLSGMTHHTQGILKLVIQR